MWFLLFSNKTTIEDKITFVSLSLSAGWEWSTMVRVTAVGMKCKWAASWPRWYKLPSTDFTGPDVACKSLAATFSEAQIHKHCHMQADLTAIVSWLKIVVIPVHTEWLIIVKTLFPGC